VVRAGRRHCQQGELLYRLETEKVNLDVDADAAAP
jgi:hypothetical protein